MMQAAPLPVADADAAPLIAIGERLPLALHLCCKFTAPAGRAAAATATATATAAAATSLAAQGHCRSMRQSVRSGANGKWQQISQSDDALSGKMQTGKMAQPPMRKLVLAVWVSRGEVRGARGL